MSTLKSVIEKLKEKRKDAENIFYFKVKGVNFETQIEQIGSIGLLGLYETKLKYEFYSNLINKASYMETVEELIEKVNFDLIQTTEKTYSQSDELLTVIENEERRNVLSICKLIIRQNKYKNNNKNG